MTQWIDGKIAGNTPLPARTGVAPFETLGASNGVVPLWDRHVARLAATAARLKLPFAPDAKLRASASELLRTTGHTNGVLRLLLLPSKDGVHTVMTTRARSPVTVVKLLPAVVQRPANAPPADIKAEPRSFHDAVLQQAQDGGADDGIVVDRDGAVLECAYGNLWLRLRDTWVTPPLDGRVLPGIARALLLDAAHRAGTPTAERPCTLDDVHSATALAHTNAVYGPRPATLLDHTATVAIVDTELGVLWKRTVAG